MHVRFRKEMSLFMNIHKYLIFYKQQNEKAQMQNDMST